MNYLLGDHLGSTSLTTDASGQLVSELRYKAWGETRHSSGNTTTKYQYTGQYSYASEFGLHFYNARWYDSSLGRFAQADTIVPGGVQGHDRYAYVSNNPLQYIDPTGHMMTPYDIGGGGGGGSYTPPCNIFTNNCNGGSSNNNGGGGSNGGNCNTLACVINGGNQGGSGNGGSGSGGCTSLACVMNNGNQAGGSGGSGGSNDGGCNSWALCAGNNSGSSGGQTLSMLNLNPDYYQPTINALYAGPVLPPSPFACGWFDCALSALSLIASGVTMTRIPQIAVPAGVVDLGVTLVATIRTNNAHNRGEISTVAQWALNGTGLAGLIPFEWGFGFSAINTIITIFRFPYP